MSVNLKAKVMRTADGLDHVNHLCVSSFGIKEFRLQNLDASRKSKSYMSAGHKPPSGGSDDFHFAPEKEKIHIYYKIEDPLGLISKATLELFRKHEDSPIWSTILKRNEYTHGLHKMEWDGKLKDANKASFPDEYITIEHSPYKMRLVIESDSLKGDPAGSWTYFHILLKSLKIILGPKEAIYADAVDDAKHKRDKAVYVAFKNSGGVPAPGKTRKLYLISNLFKRASGEMNNNTAFTVYSDLWGTGPRLPLLAQIRLADSKNNAICLEKGPGAKALGKVKFLWDWEDECYDGSTYNCNCVDPHQSQAKPKDFIKAAIDYYKDNTNAHNKTLMGWIKQPKGDNCHVDKGGKRGDASNMVFPGQPGYTPKKSLDQGKFPFKVEECGTRFWASYSYAWTSGKLAGQTGILFRPARIAGDAYKISVYLAYDKKKPDVLGKKDVVLNVTDDAPLKVPKALVYLTGTIEIWRELHIARYIRKKNTIADFITANINGIKTAYREAFVEVQNKITANDNYEIKDHRKSGGVALDYNKICEDAMVATGNSLFTEHFAAPSNADHKSEAAMFSVRSYADFKIAVRNWFQVNNPAYNVAQVNTATNNWLNTEQLNTAARYSNKLYSILPRSKVLNDLNLISGSKQGVNKASAEGIVIVHFDYLHSQLSPLVAAGTAGITILQGSAVDVSDATRNKRVFVFYVSDLGTFVHEVGHHLFLPHSKHHIGNASVPAGSQDDRHDDDDDMCLMSYSNNTVAFCGLCQLRLRGWDATKLKKNDADNTKP
ncbi:MAG: hypothetical protein Q8K98_05190 [Bacteroidota bacterium]|nr:hypothetical protein [Bacteroidota bacterium]